MNDIGTRAIQAENTLRQRELSKMKWIASGLFGCAVGLYVLGKYFAGQQLAWGYLVAFAEAAMIGALADWFAVVALFRHPLGLPIPHTAIVSRNKRSIGDSLADFVVGQFLSAAVIEQRLKRYDAARHLSQWLAKQDNRGKVTGYLGQAISYGVKALDDRRIHDFLAGVARNKLRSVALAGFVANGLELITHDNRHRKILHDGLHRFADYLEDEGNTEKVTEFVKGWSENAFVQSMIEPFVPTIRAAAVMRLRAAAEDESGGLYLAFDEQVQSYVSRLHQDPSLHEWVDRKKNELLDHPEFGRQIEALWDELRDWVVLDMSHSDSVIIGKISGLVGEFEQHLIDNEDFRIWVNEQIQTVLIQTAHANKGMLGEVIREEIIRWDDKYMVDQLELYLGRDLQFVRINGTLVGGLFGLLIYTVTMLVTSA